MCYIIVERNGQNLYTLKGFALAAEDMEKNHLNYLVLVNKTYNEQEIRAHYRALTQYLIENKLTITTMESATSGQIASLITDTEGASAVLKGAFITYSNMAKIQQGVPEETILKYSVYSRETAEAMARACMKAYDADIGIGITGTMGNVDPANPDDSVPGQLYFAIGMQDNVTSYHIELSPQPSRLMYKLAAAEEVYKVLIGKLIEEHG